MSHKHKWENVMDVWSTDSTRELQILLCDECKSVKVIYKDIKKTRIIHKPEVK
jgi:hypothetical protein